MHPEDSRTSPPDVKSAAPQRRMRREVREKCSQLFALNAARSARCPSSLPKAKRFIAASASQQREPTERNRFDLILCKKTSIETRRRKIPHKYVGFFFIFLQNYLYLDI